MVARQDIAEIVVQGIGVAVARPEGLGVLVGRSVLHGGVVGDIVGRQAVEAVVALPVVLKTAFDLELEAVDDGPVECGVGVPGGADALGVIVPN